MEIKAVTLGGMQCRYSRIENVGAPKLVFLMGALQEIESVAFYNQGLSEKYDYFVVELPGQGAADALHPSYNCAFIASCLHEFIEEKVKDNFYFVVCSYSTSTALEYAKVHQNRIIKMVLAGAMAHLPEDTWPDLLLGLTQQPPQMAERFLRMITDPRAEGVRHELIVKTAIRSAVKYINRLPTHFRNNTIRLISYSPGDLSCIGVPVLAFTGEYDGFVTPARCKAMAGSLSNCAFVIMPGCDHLFAAEKPDLTLSTILDFLAA